MLLDRRDFSVEMDVGQKARIRFAQGRVWSTVLGWKASHHILVDISEEDDESGCLQRGASCEVQYLKEGVINRFETEVLDVVDSTPKMKFLVLQFPESLETKNMRKFPRIRIQIPAKVIDSSNHTWQCMIHDISRGGCKAEICEAKFSIEEELTLFSFLPHQGPLVDVVCRVKNYYGDDCYGLDFQDLNPVQQKTLHDFHKLLSTLCSPEGQGQDQEVLSANLEHISLPDLLQVLTRSGKDYQIDIVNGPKFGQIFLKDGDIFNAHTSDLSGQEAIFELFSLSEARCRVQKAGSVPKRNVHAKLDQLILEFVYRLDERATA